MCFSRDPSVLCKVSLMMHSTFIVYFLYFVLNSEFFMDFVLSQKSKH